MLQKPIEFWIAVLVAVIIKLKTSEAKSFVSALVTILVSIGAAYAFTEPLAAMLGYSETLLAALVTLTSESLMRWVLKLVNNPDQLKEWIQVWRGK